MAQHHVSEREWQRQVLDTAKACGWRPFHVYDSRKSEGVGFPDLVLVKLRIIYVELKTNRGRLTPEQQEWRDDLLAAGGEWYLWRPSDWELVLSVLGEGCVIDVR